MTVQRRRFLRLAASAAALPALPRFVWAQSYGRKSQWSALGGGPADCCRWGRTHGRRSAQGKSRTAFV